MSKFLSRKIKSFDQRIKDGELFDLDGAADITGYSPRYLSKLCDDKEVPHMRRNGAGYFFTPEHIEGIFQFVEPRGRRG